MKENLKAKCIVAIGRNSEIGRNGDLPWHIPEDLAHFKKLTLGHPVIMGRKTWDSLPKRPLPGRKNIVISRNQNLICEGAEIANSIEDAIKLCSEDIAPFIIGGYQIYNEAMRLCDQLFVTEIDAEVVDADCYFPKINFTEWEIVSSSDWQTSKNGQKYRFVDYKRI